jgi:hypothetical protein
MYETMGDETSLMEAVALAEGLAERWDVCRRKYWSLAVVNRINRKLLRDITAPVERGGEE